MTTDFTYGGKQILSNGPFKPNGKDMPSDARTRVECYADIATIPTPYVGLKITVKADETNNNKMTDYIVKSLKANSAGIANMLIDEVVRYVDYLGASSGGGVSQEDINTAVNNYLTEHPVAGGATAEQAAQIQANTAAIGTEELTTTAKTLKGAINEVFQDVDNGKTLIASAITDKGITTSNTDTFQTMANNISSISSSDMATDPYRTDRILVWEDDFNGSSLNTDNWGYEQGLVRNAEIQYYTTDSKNVYVENSNLVLHAIKENIEGYNGPNATTFKWTSGSITSKHKQEFQYGRIEAKIKFPGGDGTFPAFWTVGNTYDFKYNLDGVNYGSKGEAWAKCGEIDIVEYYNKSVTSGVFINTSGTNEGLGRVFNNAYSDFISEYHIYSLEWTKNKIEFYIDDRLTSSIDITDDMYMLRMPHYIILNFAMGASGGTPSDTATDFSMYVDWVRVYADKNINTLSNIQLSSENINLANVGNSKQLRVTYTPETAFKKAVVWSTDNPDIAVVYGGNVYAKSLGQTNINATVNGITKSCIVTVGTGVVTSTLESISAVYTQGDTVVYPTTPLDNLKSNLVVTGNYSDGTTKTITDYSLNGTLTVGTSTVTVTYNGKTTTFNVAVSEVAEENVLFSFNSSEGTDVNTIFNISKGETNSIKSEVVYNSDGYLEIVEKQQTTATQDGFIRVEPKNFTASGNIEIEARLSVEAYRKSATDADTEGVRIGIDNGSEGIYISLTQKYGVRYFNGSSVIPVSTSTVGTITANTMFNLKINIDFANKNNAKIYMNDTLLDTIDHSNWTKSAYSNRNNFFIMARNAIATVNTIKIKNI